MKVTSKSRFKSRALQYFREVQQTGEPIVITDRGVPVLKVVPYSVEEVDGLDFFRDTVLEYAAPFDPAVAPDEWEACSEQPFAAPPG